MSYQYDPNPKRHSLIHELVRQDQSTDRDSVFAPCLAICKAITHFQAVDVV